MDSCICLNQKEEVLLGCHPKAVYHCLLLDFLATSDRFLFWKEPDVFDTKTGNCLGKELSLPLDHLGRPILDSEYLFEFLPWFGAETGEGAPSGWTEDLALATLSRLSLEAEKLYHLISKVVNFGWFVNPVSKTFNMTNQFMRVSDNPDRCFKSKIRCHKLNFKI